MNRDIGHTAMLLRVKDHDGGSPAKQWSDAQLKKREEAASQMWKILYYAGQEH